VPDSDAVLKLVGRDRPLLSHDLRAHEAELRETIGASRILVIGGAGSIGQAVVREIFRRGPAALHVVDLSENNLVELVRDLRSSLGYIDGDFRTFALDCGSPIFAHFHRSEGPYEMVLNLSAMKHVRSERDPFTLLRMLQVNVVNTVRTLEWAGGAGTERYFCVSTDKAANPVNLMGGSKRIMEMFLQTREPGVITSTARFANVAFSDGSLLHGFGQRLQKRQPLSAPQDVRRYFLTARESGELCLLAAVLGRRGEIFFPKLDPGEDMLTFSAIAERYLLSRGFEPVVCQTEDEARGSVDRLSASGKWPCYFFDSDTTGEKQYEEFVSEGETAELDRFGALGVITGTEIAEAAALEGFLDDLARFESDGTWTKEDLLQSCQQLLPALAHAETGRNLDQRM